MLLKRAGADPAGEFGRCGYAGGRDRADLSISRWPDLSGKLL